MGLGKEHTPLTCGGDPDKGTDPGFFFLDFVSLNYV